MVIASKPSSCRALNTSLVGNLNTLMQTPTKCVDEYDALSEVTRLMSEMKGILDSPHGGLYTTTGRKSETRFERSMIQQHFARTDPADQILVKKSLLKELTRATNESLHHKKIPQCNNEHVLINPSLLIEACEHLMRERDELLKETLALVEATREEAELLAKARRKEITSS